MTLLRQVVNQTHFKVVQLENYEGDPNPAFARLYVNDTQREVVKGVKVGSPPSEFTSCGV